MNINTLEKYLDKLKELIKENTTDRKRAAILKAQVFNALKALNLYDFESVKIESLTLNPSSNILGDPYKETIIRVINHLEAKIALLSKRQQLEFGKQRGFSLTAADRTNFENINLLKSKDSEITDLNSQIENRNDLLASLRNENDSLKNKLGDLQSKLKTKRIFDFIKLIGGPTVFISIIGGAFVFGLYFGPKKDDEVRFNLREQNKILQDSIKILNKKLDKNKL